MHHITQRARLWALWKLTSAHISITFFFLAVVLSPTHTHTHTDTHEAAHHVATCQAVSWLHRCDSFSDLQSLKSLSLCRWWSSGNLLTSHYWHYELSGIVCVSLCVCCKYAYAFRSIRFRTDVMYSHADHVWGACHSRSIFSLEWCLVLCRGLRVVIDGWFVHY